MRCDRCGCDCAKSRAGRGDDLRDYTSAIAALTTALVELARTVQRIERRVEEQARLRAHAQNADS